MMNFLKKLWQIPSKSWCQDHIKETLPYKPKWKFARVISVYDGDTITVMRRSNPFTKCITFKIRLAHIDCPELRSKDNNEKRIAYIAKEYLEKLVLWKIVALEILGYDKYGRLLCNIYINKNNVAILLLNNHLAIKYEGKTKQKIDWASYYKGDAV